MASSFDTLNYFRSKTPKHQLIRQNESASQTNSMINQEYEILGNNLKALDFKREEQKQREDDLVLLTKALRNKAQQLTKKESMLNLKQVKIQEKDQFWNETKACIKETETQLRVKLDESENKIKIIEDKQNVLSGKQQSIQKLEQQLNKKLEQYDERQSILNQQVLDYNNERDSLDQIIVNQKEETKQKQQAVVKLKDKISQEQLKLENAQSQQNVNIVEIENWEGKLTNQTLELERKSTKYQKDKQWLREKEQENNIWEKECFRDEDDLQALRLQVARRKEMVAKKEVSVLQWSKRNHQDFSKHEREFKDLQDLMKRQEFEQTDLESQLKQLKRKDEEEVGKQRQVLELKKKQLASLKHEEEQLNKECLKIEQEIRIMDLYTKNHFDMQENLELKMMGLELSEEMWRKKYEEHQQTLKLEKTRLDKLEQSLKQRQNAVLEKKKAKIHFERQRSSQRSIAYLKSVIKQKIKHRKQIEFEVQKWKQQKQQNESGTEYEYEQRELILE